MRYMSPEQINNILAYKSDIWAFGCVLLEMITGKMPYFDIRDNIQICTKISIEQINPLQYFVQSLENTIIPVDFEQILNSCFSFDLKTRPTAKFLLV